MRSNRISSSMKKPENWLYKAIFRAFLFFLKWKNMDRKTLKKPHKLPHKLTHKLTHELTLIFLFLLPGGRAGPKPARRFACGSVWNGCVLAGTAGGAPHWACGHGMAYGAVPHAAALLSRRAACAPMPPHAGGAARRPAAAGADIPANFSGKNLPRVPHYVQKAHAFVQCIRQNDKF